MSSSLTHHFLIATPQIKSPTFAGSLVYLLDHNTEGASGIIINRPLNVQFQTLFMAQHDSDKKPDKPSALPSQIHPEPIVYFGGPVANDRGFVLHPCGHKRWHSTIDINDAVALTTSSDIIEDIASSQGPDKTLIALGYAGWSSHQLEQELLDNAWIAVPASDDILFNTAIEQRLEKACAALGINMSLLMPESGHA